MIEFVDFSKKNVKDSPKGYSGESGAKIGVIYNNEQWLIKYPKSTKGLVNPKLSYTTSPLSEYIGSHIYELFDIQVHATLLGFRDNKLVVGCKDFEENKFRLLEFKNIKNRFNTLTFDNGTSGSGTLFNEVLTVLNTDEVLASVEGVIERFWDMFVIDAFIGNQDRNNSNWGILFKNDFSELIGLAPVYDNGNAFYNKRDIDTFESRLNDESLMYQDAITRSVCVYLSDDNHHIKPFDYLAKTKNPDLLSAIERFLNKYNEQAIGDLIQSIPEKSEGYDITSQPQKDFYLKLLALRYEYIQSCAVKLQ
jgi:hypothetical protein